MSDRNHRGKCRLCGGLSGKYFWRCAAFCALLFGFMVMAEPLAFTVLADEVTEESIKEKENQIEAAKQERKQVQSSISNLKTMKANLENKKADLKDRKSVV